jgi:hypothetical protein
VPYLPADGWQRSDRAGLLAILAEMARPPEPIVGGVPNAPIAQPDHPLRACALTISVLLRAPSGRGDQER